MREHRRGRRFAVGQYALHRLGRGSRGRLRRLSIRDNTPLAFQLFVLVTIVLLLVGIWLTVRREKPHATVAPMGTVGLLVKTGWRDQEVRRSGLGSTFMTRLGIGLAVAAVSLSGCRDGQPSATGTEPGACSSRRSRASRTADCRRGNDRGLGYRLRSSRGPALPGNASEIGEQRHDGARDSFGPPAHSLRLSGNQQRGSHPARTVTRERTPFDGARVWRSRSP